MPCWACVHVDVNNLLGVSVTYYTCGAHGMRETALAQTLSDAQKVGFMVVVCLLVLATCWVI